MSLESRIAQELLRSHPGRAAAALERAPIKEAARLLTGIRTTAAARVVESLSPHVATSLLETLAADRTASIIEELTLDVAARVVRRLREERRLAVLENLPPMVRRTLETLLRFPEGTAGAMMDPAVLAVSEDLTAREALARVRQPSENAQYNLYVVDQGQCLVGVLNLRELLRARPQARLSELMIRDPTRLSASTDRSVLVGHPAWRDLRAIPVVDDRGGYLGALRYHTVRDMEDRIFGQRGADADSSAALGELLATGATGLLDALTSPLASGKGNP